MDAPGHQASDLTEHLAAVGRHWRLVLALTALGVLVAAGAVVLLPRTYQATTAVLVLPTGSQDANAANGRTKSEINLDTEAQLVTSTAVATRAGRLLHRRIDPAVLGRSVTVAVPPNSTVLHITYAAGDPAAARDGSRAFATAYLANRGDAAAAANDRAARALDTRIDGVTRQLRTVTARLTAQPPGSSRRAFLDSQRRSLNNQLDDLTDRRTAATTGSTDGGRIISAAQLPTAPVSPSVPLDLGAGALIGLLAGLAAALAWSRFGRRVRYADDLPRYAGVPVLAELSGAPDTAPGTGDDERTFDRLRNELAAARRPTAAPPAAARSASAPAAARTGAAGPAAATGGPDHTMIVVAGTGPGPTVLDVAAGLATAFARSGATTILLDASRRAGVGPAGAPAGPGWADVLSGTPLNDVLYPADTEPRLRILPPGTGTGAGPMPVQTARVALTALRTLATWVVVAAPDTSSGADAQTLAAVADSAILAVELRTAGRSAVTDADQQLRRVGAPVLGAVVLPRRPRPAPPPGATSDDPGTTDRTGDTDPDPDTGSTTAPYPDTDLDRDTDVVPGSDTDLDRDRDVDGDDRNGGPASDEEPAAAGVRR